MVKNPASPKPWYKVSAYIDTYTPGWFRIGKTDEQVRELKPSKRQKPAKAKHSLSSPRSAISRPAPCAGSKPPSQTAARAPSLPSGREAAMTQSGTAGAQRRDKERQQLHDMRDAILELIDDGHDVTEQDLVTRGFETGFVRRHGKTLIDQVIGLLQDRGRGFAH